MMDTNLIILLIILIYTTNSEGTFILYYIGPLEFDTEASTNSNEDIDSTPSGRWYTV